MMEVVSAVSAALGSVAKYKKAVDLAARDGLTGLYNRRIFNDVLQREFSQAQRHNYPLSLLSLDLDHFKSVNDNFGHQTGDLVLRAVAEVIAKVARSTDLPARIGGEEFAIILPHTSQIQAGHLAGRLRHILTESDFNLSGTVFRQTVSQGVAGLEHFLVKTPEDMVYWADQALYLAKREGRDTIRLATDLPMTPVLKKDGPYAFQ
jgi:diguanylate cyclase (GGDEF)-like protein